MVTYLLHHILLPLLAEEEYWVLKTEGVWVTGRKKTDRNSLVEGWWQRLLSIRRKFCCNISDNSPVSMLLCLNIPKVEGGKQNSSSWLYHRTQSCFCAQRTVGGECPWLPGVHPPGWIKHPGSSLPAHSPGLVASAVSHHFPKSN